MAQRQPCNHAYGLTIVRCPDCGAHIASRCPHCSYVGVCDDHSVDCGRARGSASRGVGSAAGTVVDRGVETGA